MEIENEDFLIEYLPPMQDKNAIVAIGRFQPPTAGHYKVFNKMKLFIREHSDMKLTPVIIVVAGEKSSLDKSKNPLTADERINFMIASGYCNGFQFFTSKNGNQGLGVCRDEGYEPIVIAAGSDRAQGYIKSLDKDFKTPDDKEIKHYIVPGLDRLESATATKKSEKSKALMNSIEKLKDYEELNDDEISGSLARRAVELGYLDEFSEIVGLEKKPALAKMMFTKIKKAMGVE